MEGRCWQDDVSGLGLSVVVEVVVVVVVVGVLAAAGGGGGGEGGGSTSWWRLVAVRPSLSHSVSCDLRLTGARARATVATVSVEQSHLSAGHDQTVPGQISRIQYWSLSALSLLSVSEKRRCQEH